MRLKLLILIALSLFIVSDLDAQRRTSQRRSDREKATEETQAEKDPLLEEYGFASRDALAEALLEADPSASDRKIIERYRSGEHLTRRQKSRLSSLLEDYKEVQLAAGSEEEKEASGRRAERRERPSREKAARARPERAARESAERSAREKRESARTRERAARTRPSRSARGAARESVDILDSGLDFSFDGTITGPPEEATKKTGSGRRRSRSARTLEETTQEVGEITAQIMTKDRSFVIVDGSGQLAVSPTADAFRWQLRPAGPQKVLAFDPVSEKSLAWTESGGVGLAAMTEDSILAEIERMVEDGREDGFPEGVKWLVKLLTGDDVLAPGLTPAGGKEIGIALLFQDDQGLTGDPAPTAGKRVGVTATADVPSVTEDESRSGRRAARRTRGRSARSLIATEGQQGDRYTEGDYTEYWDMNDNGIVDRIYKRVWRLNPSYNPRYDWTRTYYPSSWYRDLGDPTIQFRTESSIFEEGHRWRDNSRETRIVVYMDQLNGVADYQADYFVTHSLSPGDTVAAGTVIGSRDSPGMAIPWIQFAVTDDIELREDETYTVTLLQKDGGNAVLGSRTTHTVSITDNDFDPTSDLLENLDRFQRNIDALVARVDGMQAYTGPASDGLSGVGLVVDQLVEIKEGSEIAKPALQAAKRIPYIGYLFTPAYLSVKPVPGIATRLANSACRVDRALDPFEQVVDKTDAMMRVIAQGLTEIGHATRRTYGLLELAKQCAAGSTFPVTADLGREGCSSGSPCSVGQGDCDIDPECAGTLLCKQRTYGEWVPGVFLTANISDVYDICYDPGAVATGTTVAVNFGGEGCSESNPCSKGGGDCDTHDECAGSLRCKQRTSGESVPGLTFFDNFPDHYDVCYDPDASLERSALAILSGARANTDFTVAVEEAQLDYLRGIGSAANVLQNANRTLNDIENQMEEIAEAMEEALSVLDDYDDVAGYISPLQSVVPSEIREFIDVVSAPRRWVSSIPFIGRYIRYIFVAEDVVIDLVMDEFDSIFDALGIPELQDMLPEFDPDLDFVRGPSIIEDELNRLNNYLSAITSKIEGILVFQTSLQLSILSDLECLEGGGQALRAELIATALGVEAGELQDEIDDYRSALDEEHNRSRDQYSMSNSCR